MRKTSALIVAVAALCLSSIARAQSFYPERLDDKTAVYVMPKEGDNTTELQKAIDHVADIRHTGIVFIGPGRYTLTHTLYVWPGVRLIGYGSQRPVFFLPPNTPGYDNTPAYMVVFAGGRTGERRRGGAQPGPGRTPPLMSFPGAVPPQTGVIDANPGTFYSAMSNIDFEAGDGNPGAVGIRFHVAQHCFLTHMEFRMGSATAALQDIGNEGEDLHFVGGRYGIMTGRPSPGWQFTLLDSTFEGQREAGILEHEAGLALIHDTFRNEPKAIDIKAGHIDELWLQNSRVENISGPAVTISREKSRLTEINFKNVVAVNTPVFAELRESSKQFKSADATYRIATFIHGLSFDGPGKSTGRDTDAHISDAVHIISYTPQPEDTRPAITPLPSQTGWANARELGVKGDDTTDDTAALQKAVNEHRIVYLPSGRYKLSDTLRLRPDSVLIGLHPSDTQLDLNDNTPGFTGAGAPKPLLLAPTGGATIVEGIGLWTGGANNLATAVMWESGKDSLMDDVRFLGGHGTNNPDGTRMNPYNSSHGGDPNPLWHWDAQYPSLWITHGGGGAFTDIWTPDTFAQAGMMISDTATEGHVYELSSEHHVRNEVIVRRSANFELIALQTEEERGEGGNCLPLLIQDSHDITVAEMHAYRVVSSFTPFSNVVEVSNSDDIYFRNLHYYSDSKVVFDNSVRDDDANRDYRELELASLTLLPHRPRVPSTSVSQLRRVATGFFNASSLSVSPSGDLYFVDTVKQHIFRFDPRTSRTTIFSDAPIDPANLWFDRAGNLQIVSYQGEGTIYSTNPATPTALWARLKPMTAAQSSTGTPVLPVDHWRFDQERRTEIGSTPKPWHFVSPDGTMFLPAGNDFTTGALYYGTKMADVLRAFELRPAAVGQTFYVTDEGQETTYAGKVNSDGSLSDVHIFADRGGEAVVRGPDNRIYLAAGQLYIYTPAGKLVDQIDIPERPTSLIFAGPGNRTLYILARTSLYALDLRPSSSK